jgi:hypothetical protein
MSPDTFILSSFVFNGGSSSTALQPSALSSYAVAEPQIALLSTIGRSHEIAIAHNQTLKKNQAYKFHLKD